MTVRDPHDLARLADAVHEMRRIVDEHIAHDPAREQAVEKLYTELRAYRDGFLVESEKPLLLDLLLLYDSFHWFHHALVHEERSPEVISDAFQFLVDELLEILYRRDVVPMEQAERFDRTLHRAVQVEHTDDSSQDQHVARVLKRGFVRKEQVLRPEEVVVFRHRADGSGS
jgi:molecular chaperone GrpE (heat shock protein)